jgi:hypothetical protein
MFGFRPAKDERAGADSAATATAASDNQPSVRPAAFIATPSQTHRQKIARPWDELHSIVSSAAVPLLRAALSNLDIARVK